MLTQDYEFLNEAEFKRENIARVMQLYRKLFGKYFGGEFKIFAEEEYKKPGEKGTGIRLINNLNYQLRFNWKFSSSNALKKANQQDKTKLYISSIDYWEPTNLDFEKPSATITFLIDVNVVQIWKGLAKVIKKGVRGKYTLKDLKLEVDDLQESQNGENSTKVKSAKFGGFADYVNEAYNLDANQRADFLVKHTGMNKSQALYKTSAKQFDKMISADADLSAKLDEYCIELNIGKKETNSTGNKLRAAEKELEQKVYSDPEYVFQDIEDLATLVAKGKLKSLIICGQGGIGKCLSNDTDVITPNGKVKISDIKPGDFVVTPKNTTAKVLEVYPQPEQQDCYRVHLKDGRYVDCDSEQLFEAYTGSNKVVISLDKIKEKFDKKEEVFIPVIIDGKQETREVSNIESIGKKDTTCILIDDSDHLFLVNDYIVVHNTFHVTKKLKEVLGEQPGPWYYHSGMKASPVSFYMKTFEERESIIVWDEADSLLLNDDIVMMLKPALDTSGDNTMEYSRGKSMKGMSMQDIKDYSKEVDQSVANGKILGLMDKKEFVHVPGKFYFEGSMIFISNMPASKIEGAILSRSVFLDVHLCARDIQKRIMSIMHAKYAGKYSDEQLQKFADAMGGFQNGPEEEVVYMTPELARKKKPVTIRSMELAIAMEEAGLQNWARLASLYA